MKGSRLPFALYLVSGETCCSLGSPWTSPLPEAPSPATVTAAGEFPCGVTAVGAGTLARTAPPRLGPPLLFATAELGPACTEEDFAEACAALVATGSAW